MPPEFDNINEALVACVKALGGSKQVGHKLWPEKTVDAAQRHLLACLNEDKAERLSPEQLALLMRMAHAKGFHGVMQFLCDSIGYADPQPIDPRDELTELLKTNQILREQLVRQNERIEKLIPFAGLRSVA
jgi:hypothetical protein